MSPPFCIAAGAVLKNVCLAAFTVRNITNQITKKFVRTTGSTPMLMAGFKRSCNILIPPVPMEMAATALLHDIVEDTEVTIEQVEITFGKQVAEIVSGATELDKLEKKAIEKKGSWQSKKEHTIHFLEHEATTDQLLVSAANKLDNLRSIVYDHKRIGEDLWPVQCQ